MCAFVEGVRDEFEGYVRDMLGRVAQDYALDAHELIVRYVVADGPLSPVSQKVAKLPVVRVEVRKKAAAPVPGAGAPKRGRRAGPGMDSLDLTQAQTTETLSGVSLPVLRKVCAHYRLKIGGNRDEVVRRIVLAGVPQAREAQEVREPQEVREAQEIQPWSVVVPVAPEDPEDLSGPPPLPEPEAQAQDQEVQDEIQEVQDVQESPQEALRRSLQAVLDKHTDTDDEDDDAAPQAWGDSDYGDEDGELVADEYV